MLYPQSFLTSPQLGRFYALSEQEAHQFDATQPEGAKYFATLLPGGNAYLLDYDAFDPFLHKDLDLGNAEQGCFVQMGQAMEQEQRLQLCSGLIALGYAVSSYSNRLLLVPWHRELLLRAVIRDLYQITSKFRKSQQKPLFPPSVEQALTWLEDACHSVSLAQDFFQPSEKYTLETEAYSLSNALLRSATLRLQRARHLLEEGRNNLDLLSRLDVRLLEPHVTATCYSDDHVIEVDAFDATLWFSNKASDEEIRALQAENYGGNYTADSIAEFAAGYDPRVRAMFEYNEELPNNIEARGFECHVNAKEAEAWLSVHRPHLLHVMGEKNDSVNTTQFHHNREDNSSRA